MEVTDIPEAPTAERSPYEQCEHCGSAVDRAQRYCVNCGTRRRHVADPAARYHSSLSARSRPPGGPPAEVSRRRPVSGGLGLALVLAVIPLAVGLGVLVGRASTSGDQKLIDALRAQRPEVVTVGGGAASSVAASSTTQASVSALSSDFPLQSGYAVELQTLRSSSDQKTVSQAEQADRAKGAKQVGLITQHDFKVSPAPPAGAYVIYSGAFKTHDLAAAALAKLIKAFPHAKVIQVRGSGSRPAGAGKVVAKTQFGSARQISGFATPTQSALQQGAQVVQKVQQTQGKNYLNSQRSLPDQISVP